MQKDNTGLCIVWFVCRGFIEQWLCKAVSVLKGKQNWNHIWTSVMHNKNSHFEIQVFEQPWDHS